MKSVRPHPALLLTTLMALIPGCPPPGGSAGNDNNDEDRVTERPPSIVLEEPRTIAGQIVLPGGVALEVTALRVATSDFSDAPSAEGDFTLNVRLRTPSFVQVVDDSGRIILMGFANPDAAEPARIDARSTAVALLYFANAGWTLFPDSLQNVLDLLDQTQAASDLAAAIEAAMAANPTALHDGDDALLAALDAAHDVTTFPGDTQSSTIDAGSPRQPKAGPRQQSAQISPLLLITPDASTRQSGVQVAHNPSGEGIVAMNNFRRRGMLYVYRTATEDEDGTRHDVTPPEQVDELEIPTTYRLSLISSVSAVLAGSASWAPVTTPPIQLSHESGNAKTFYAAVVIGSTFDFVGTPSVVSDPQFANFVPTWTAVADSLQWKLVLFDFFIPILETVGVGGALSSMEAASAASLSAFIATLNPILLEQGIAVPRTNAQATAFLRAAIQEMADDAIFSTRVIMQLQSFWPAALSTQTTLSALQTNVSAAARSASILRAIQLAMGALDIGAVVKDNQSSSWADDWEVVAAPRTVHVNPTSTPVEVGETRTFTATLSSPPSGSLVYVWSTSGNHGHLGDGITQGDEVASRYPTIVYSSDPNARAGDRDTITVLVFLESSDGSRALVGELEEPAEVIAQLDPVCDDLDVAPYQSACGSISLSNADITAGEFMTVTVNVGCGGGTLYCDYVAAGTLEIDGSPSSGDSGAPGLYGYDPPTPIARGNGAGVALSMGSHTIRFQIPLSAPNDCLAVGAAAFGGNTAVGPWCFLGGGSPNTWSSVAYFRVRQRGL